MTVTLWSSDAVPSSPSGSSSSPTPRGCAASATRPGDTRRSTVPHGVNAARSAAVAASFSTRKVWSLWAAMTTSSKYPTLSFAFAFAVSLSVFESPPRVSVQVTETAPLAPAACRRTEVTSAFRRTAPAGSAPTTASTYALLLPFTTRHKGRSTMFSRWWFTQNRMSVTMGNAAVSLSEQLQIAAHIVDVVLTKIASTCPAEVLAEGRLHFRCLWGPPRRSCRTAKSPDHVQKRGAHQVPCCANTARSRVSPTYLVGGERERHVRLRHERRARKTDPPGAGT